MPVKCTVVENWNENKMIKFPTTRYHSRIVIYIRTLLLFQLFTVSVGINAHVDLHVGGSGFHRHFTYHIELNNFTEENCYVALFYKLPSALYVNVNELADLRRLKKIEVCSEGETDVESFMENANSQNVSACTRLKNNFHIITLPIHQRYRYPKEDGTYEDIILKKPNLLIGCETKLKEYRVSKLNLCPLCAELALKWREIPYDGVEYVWTIPTGDISLSSAVTFITLSVTTIGTIFLMKTIWKTPSINRQKDD